MFWRTTEKRGLWIQVETVWSQGSESLDAIALFRSTKRCILFPNLLDYHNGEIVNGVIRLIEMMSNWFIQTLVFNTQPVAIQTYAERIFSFSNILAAYYISYAGSYSKSVKIWLKNWWHSTCTGKFGVKVAHPVASKFITHQNHYFNAGCSSDGCSNSLYWKLLWMAPWILSRPVGMGLSGMPQKQNDRPIQCITHQMLTSLRKHTLELL